LPTLDSLQQHAGGLVVAAFFAGQFGLGGHQLAAKGLGQDRLRDTLDPALLPTGYCERRE
jgi:hypothetical protein